jgi:hypothetical protein
VIRKVWRKVAGFFASAGLAVGLLIFVGLWSLLATFVPQGGPASLPVKTWAASHTSIEPLVRAIGLHQAFASIIFTLTVALLAISTGVCAWRRTKVAIKRVRTLRAATRTDKASLAEKHDLTIACRSELTESEVLTTASEALSELGIKSKRRGDVISAVSSSWAAWGSPIFHWALLALIVAAFVGGMTRSDGQIAVAVGQTKVDTPKSYVFLSAGPWRDWSRVHRSVRVDAFDPDYKTGGIDRGAVPTVSVLDADGKVLVKQLVYPNMKLHSGSLSINAPSLGLSVMLAFLDANGTELGRTIEPVDFSQTTTGGTVPLESFTRRDQAGKVIMRLNATVPLDLAPGGGYGEWIPKQPKARVVVLGAAGTTLVDRTLLPGESVTLPGGGAVRLGGLDWYSRLSLVDDSTIPLIYGAMVLAMLGLTLTAVGRQQLLVAAVLTGSDGVRLAVDVRLWRNVPTSAGEIKDTLGQALGPKEESTP